LICHALAPVASQRAAVCRTNGYRVNTAERASRAGAAWVTRRWIACVANS
jgi:hypothetical protein